MGEPPADSLLNVYSCWCIFHPPAPLFTTSLPFPFFLISSWCKGTQAHRECYCNTDWFIQDCKYWEWCRWWLVWSVHSWRALRERRGNNSLTWLFDRQGVSVRVEYQQVFLHTGWPSNWQILWLEAYTAGQIHTGVGYFIFWCHTQAGSQWYNYGFSFCCNLRSKWAEFILLRGHMWTHACMQTPHVCINRTVRPLSVSLFGQYPIAIIYSISLSCSKLWFGLNQKWGSLTYLQLTVRKVKEAIHMQSQRPSLTSSYDLPSLYDHLLSRD